MEDQKADLFCGFILARRRICPSQQFRHYRNLQKRGCESHFLFAIVRHMSPRTLSDEPLQVQPDLIGKRLASPFRRAMTFALDFALLLVPSLLLATGAAAISLSAGDPQAFRGIRSLLMDSSLD
jgi:hypothetical protein